ncbi:MULTISPECIES: FecCD family ABC transporter permease [Shinella]|uniref:Iron chelate uptake ABC transporter family permease subunit n=1 Tax=Shinella sedimenti TaxID=2919913 RepID=A0ABT0CQU7_9HYPH|nr:MULTISPECIES: iron chelate uptake ABC transporter family permease subunit [Shinella]MCJ8150729.1 iron chelate uptake ABC transporter family permease subunit [Shinella sedimenti]
MKTAPASVCRLGQLSVRWHPRVAVFCGLLILVLAVLTVLLLSSGSLSLSLKDVVATLIGQSDDAKVERVILRIRLPRVLTAILVGGALGMSGSIFQSISRNALGSPDIIGFTTGAATGAIVQIMLLDAGPLETSAAAVVSGVLTAVMVFLLARKGRSTGGYHLVLIGIGVGATLSGINTILLVRGDLDQAASAQLWLAGSLNTRTWAHVVPAAIGFVLVLPVAIAHARSLNLLEMGDDAARQLGVDAERTRLLMIMAAVGLTSIATAAAGPIAFVALAAPQLARRLGGSPDVPVLSSALMGMVLLMAADLFSQHLPLEIHMPIGLTTGFLGGFYLLWLLVQSKSV